MKTIKRRRKQGKTDYLKRLDMLKGNKPRLVFRKTNKYVTAQYVESKMAQDKVVFGVSSQNLLKYGWPKEGLGNLKSLTAAYLLGYLTGNKIKKEKFKTPIVDFGMQRVLAKAKQQAFLKGLVDSGLGIGVKEEAFPDEKRIKGEHLKNKVPFQEVKLKIEKGN